MEVSFEKGLHLRTSRHLLPAGSLLNCMNLVPDELGVLRTRRGMALIGTIADQAIVGYYSMYGHTADPPQVDVSYQATRNVGRQISIFRNFQTLLAGPISELQLVDFCDMREYQRDHHWTFMAGGHPSFRIKDDGAVTRPWGIAAPTVAPTVALGAAGSLTGTYTYRYIFVRHDSVLGTIAVSWSNPSPESAAISPAGQQVSVSAIQNPSVLGTNTDPQVTHAYIFRNVASTPGVWLLTAILALSGNSFTDNRADADMPLVSSLPSGLLEFDNGLPPVFRSITVHQERIWGVTGQDNRVYFSKVQRPEQFSATGYLEIGPLSETCNVVRAFSGRLYVGTDTHLIPILGTDETTYVTDTTPVPVGVVAPLSMTHGLRGLYFRGPDGVYIWNGATVHNITDEALYPIFHGETVHPFLPAASAVHPFGPQYLSAGAWFQGRYYVTVWVSLEGTLTPTLYVYDEASQSWYPDSRQVNALYYARQDEQLIIGGWVSGAFRCDVGTTDAGTPIAWTLQTRDVASSEPTAAHALQDLVIESDSRGSVVTVTAIRDYSSAADIPLGPIQSAGHTQQVVGASAGQVVGHALGYRLQGVGPMVLYRLVPRLFVYPEVRKTFHLPPTDLGTPAMKCLQHVVLDIEFLGNPQGPMLLVLTMDGTPVTVRLSATGRVRTGRLRLPRHTLGRVLELTVVGEGPWRLWRAEVGFTVLGSQTGLQVVPVMPAAA
jgi:hypothetical protein